MAQDTIEKIFEGFKKFRNKYFEKQDFFEDLRTNGQAPHTLVITCSDSRVDPSILFATNPGDIFVVRNVANLVPPFETGGGFHGVSAAIEFAVLNIKVKNVVVLGHRQCGGIRSLMETHETQPSSFVGQWMKIAEKAKNNVLLEHPKSDFESQCKYCEFEGIRTSLENLRSFPFIVEKENLNEVQLLGLYFDLEEGHLYKLSNTTSLFEKVV